MARFILGEGEFDQIMQTARGARDELQAIMTAQLAAGVPLFDQNYQPIAGAKPAKFRTQYDAKLEKLMQPVYDRAAKSVPGGVFCLAVDTNGYAPTHNSWYSQPLSGDPAKDLINSRDKRKFADVAGLRAARSTQSFLLQTYTRDTGEVLSEVVLPIMLSGKHWGGFRLGFNPEELLESLGRGAGRN
ncbi:hypothetical protein [Chromobacterium haemolyticum]|uniref:hypothetical protein n=1 Tax=Chromobacterium haemolyticum TaxID=394935 RepID=UPI001177F1C6|nr:hypothetical protein [Chromobacterium haemolyticum]